MWVAWVTKICLNPYIQLTGRLHVSEHGSVLERNSQMWHGFPVTGSNKVFSVSWEPCTQTITTWEDGIELLQYTLAVGFLTIFGIISLFKMTWISATGIRRCVFGTWTRYISSVCCGSNCALERSRRQPNRVPTMRSLLLPSVLLQLRWTYRKGPTVLLPSPSSCNSFNACGILSILFESSSGLSLDLEFFVLLPLCAWPPCHHLHTCLFWWGSISLIWEMGTEILYHHHKTLKNLSKGRAFSAGK